MCYRVWMMYINDPLLLIEIVANEEMAAGFLSLSQWSFIVCPTPYNVNKYVLSAKLVSSIIFNVILINIIILV